MKIIKNVFLSLIIIIIFIISFKTTSKVIQYFSDSAKIKAEISALTNKIDMLEQKINSDRQNVNKSLDNFQKRIWDCEDNIKLQNQFLQIQFDKWQKYYIEHWK